MNAIAQVHSTSLLLYTLIAVVGLIVLIARFKVNAIIALVLASLFIGLCAHMEPSQLLKAFREGVGSVLGSIAMILGFGSMLGKMLAESGGAERIANTLVERFGERRVHWAMMLIACIVGVPVFFQVGFVLLIPLVFLLARQTKTPLLKIGIPMIASLSVMHGLVPPHPGPMAAIEVLKADVGKTVFYSLLVAVPTAIVAGPLLGMFLARRVQLEASGSMTAQFTTRFAGQSTDTTGRTRLPGFGITIFTVVFPVLLMLLATAADVFLTKADRFRQVVDFIGDPIVAMLIAALFSFYSLGFARDFSKEQILKFSEECLAPIAGVLLIIGAGGGFSRVLAVSGVGDAVAALTAHSHVPPLFLGWLIAALIRISTGSATVSITTAAGLVAPIVALTPGVNLELMVVAMGAGSLICSHVNDSGFWMVKEYFGMSVTQTLRSWTVVETVVSVVALVMVLLLNLAG
jgi:gluconate:H+ symporter, GntP family